MDFAKLDQAFLCLIVPSVENKLWGLLEDESVQADSSQEEDDALSTAEGHAIDIHQINQDCQSEYVDVYDDFPLNPKRRESISLSIPFEISQSDKTKEIFSSAVNEYFDPIFGTDPVTPPAAGVTFKKPTLCSSASPKSDTYISSKQL